MKLIVSVVACVSIMFAGSGFAALKQSHLSAKQAWQIAAENQLPPHQQRQKPDRYLHSLSTDELFAVVRPTGAELALMRFTRGDHVRQADAILVKEPAIEVELRQSGRYASSAPELTQLLLSQLFQNDCGFFLTEACSSKTFGAV